MDDGGRIWLTSIYAPNKEISVDAVGGLIVNSGLAVVDLHFDNWDQLVEYRRTASMSTGPRFPAYANYSPADVCAAIRDTQTAEDPEEIAAARSMLLHILEQTKALDHPLRAKVTHRLIELDASRLSTASSAAHEVPPMVFKDAMDRYDLPAVA